MRWSKRPGACNAAAQDDYIGKTVFKSPRRRTQMLLFEGSTSESKLTRLSYAALPALFGWHSQGVHRSLGARLEACQRRLRGLFCVLPVIATVARKSSGLLRIQGMVFKADPAMLRFQDWHSLRWLMQERPSDAVASNSVPYISRMGSRRGRNSAVCDLQPQLSRGPSTGRSDSMP